MTRIRRALYALGIRPRPSSRFYDPELALRTLYEDAVLGRLR